MRTLLSGVSALLAFAALLAIASADQTGRESWRNYQVAKVKAMREVIREAHSTQCAKGMKPLFEKDIKIYNSSAVAVLEVIYDLKSLPDAERRRLGEEWLIPLCP